MSRMSDDNQPAVWTVKRLRDALAQFPSEADDLPFAVCVPDGDAAVTFALTGAPQFQLVDWGDGRGFVPDERYVEAEAFAYLMPYRDRLEISDIDTPRIED